MIRLVQVVLMVGGICLIGLVGLMTVLRREPSSAAWMVYESGVNVYRSNPNGNMSRELMTLQHPVGGVIELPNRDEFLFTTIETDRMGRTDQILGHCNLTTGEVKVVLRLHELFDVETVSSDGSQLFILTAHYSDIYWFDWEKRTLENLTETPNIREFFVGAASNGEFILFTPNRPSNAGLQIYSTFRRRTSPLIMTGRYKDYSFVTFSPDNEWIYLSGLELDERVLVRIRLSTNESEFVFRSQTPFSVGDWSPNGLNLPLTLRDGNTTKIVLVDTSNSKIELRELTRSVDRNEYLVDWSLDGSWLLVVSFHELNNDQNYYRVHSNGSGTQQVMSFKVGTTYIGKSLVGEWSLFQENDERNRPILFSLSFEKELKYQLTLGEDFPEFKTWSPDGEWVYFVGGSNGDRQLYRVRIDGSQRQQLTYEETDADFLLWSPVID